MFSSSATPFGTGSGFGTGTSKLFFSIYIKSKCIQNVLDKSAVVILCYVFFATFTFPCCRLNQKRLFVMVSV